MKKIMKCAVVTASVLSTANTSLGMIRSSKLCRLSRTNSTTSLPNLPEKGGRIPKMKSLTPEETNSTTSLPNPPKKGGRISKVKSLTPEEWSNLEKGDDLSLFTQENKQSFSSDEVYDDPIRPEDPTEKFVQIDEKTNVYISIRHTKMRTHYSISCCTEHRYSNSQ